MSDYNLFPDIPPWFFVAFLICAAIGFLTVVGLIGWFLYIHIKFV